jgi:PAS domain S-box-containing protein
MSPARPERPAANRGNEVWLRSVMESTADGLLVVDQNGRVIIYNGKFAELWRIPKRLLDPHDDNVLLQYVLDQLAEPEAFLAKVRALYRTNAQDMDEIRFKDGRVFERYSMPLLLEGAVMGRVWSFRDITGRKRAEEALHESEERYRLLLQNANDAVWVCEVSPAAPGRFLDVNDKACEMLGYTREELLAMEVPQIDTPEQRKRFPAVLRQLYETGSIVFETEHVAKDGRRIPVEVSVRQFALRGKPLNLAVVRDITDRKLAERALRESEASLRSIFRAAPVGIGLVCNRVFMQCNERLCEMTGYQADELIGRNARMIYPDDAEYQRVGREKYGQIREHGTGSIETLWLRKDGTVINVLLSSTPLDPADLSQGVTFTALNITERKRAEEALRSSEERFKLIASSTPDHLIVQDRELRYTLVVNPQLGLKETDMIGKTDHDFLSREDADRLTGIKRQVLETGEPVSVEVPLTPAEGGQEFFSGSYVPKFDAQGRIDGLIGYFRNVTELKRAEEKLKRSLADKEILLRELYHRTKNNMQVIRAMLALRAAREESPAVDAIVRDTDRRIQAMSMVHQMLYRSQDLSMIDLHQYIRDLATLLLRSYRLSTERVVLELDVEDLKASIDLAVPCGLILNELMSNAMRHAFPGDRPGTIRIRLVRVAPEALEMTFSDDGVGTPPGFDPRAQDSLGFRTIIALTEEQLRGQALFDSDGGAIWKLRFREPPELPGAQP